MSSSMGISKSLRLLARSRPINMIWPRFSRLTRPLVLWVMAGGYSARRSIHGHVQVVQLARRLTLAVSPFCGLSLTIHLSHVFANPRRHGCQGDSRVLHGMRSFGTWVFADALEADP